MARVLGAVGRALISSGVIVLLFVAYQLWGTGLQHQQAQDNLERDFLELLESDLVEEVETTSQANDEPEVDDSTDDAVDPSAAVPAGSSGEVLAEPVEPEIVYSQEQLEVIYPEAGTSLARIVIPDINVDQIVVEGVSVEDLREGPGHYPSTPNPGQAGNASIAGHRTTYGAPFHRIDELEPGAEIIVTTLQGTFRYAVRQNQAPDGSTLGHFIVSPKDTWVLGQETGENLLTLTACHPKYSARQRIIVQAEMIGEPAPTPPRPERADDDTDDTDADSGTLSAGEEDERAAAGEGVEAGSDVESVIGDDVAADDDPSVDADGNPIDPADGVPEADDEAGTDGQQAGAISTGDDQAADDTSADDTSGDDTAGDDTAGDETAGDDEVPDEAADARDDELAADDASDTDGEPGAASDAAPEASSVAADSPNGVADETSGEPVELIDDEVAAADDFGEGLNGDSTKIRPAIMWGLAGGAIWLAAWFIGQRLNRKWTLYLIGLVPFIPVLWSCFVNIDQALPSY